MSLTTFTKATLSSSPFGRSIAVTGTTSPGALIHVPSLSQLDEIYLYAQNNGASSITLNILWGGTTVYDLTQTLLAPQNGRTMLTDGKLLTGAGIIGAYLSAPGTVAIDGFVNRIVPGIDPRVVDWANRVVANGGATPSANTQQVLTTFVQGLSNAGLLSNMVVVNCMVPDSLIACLTPLLRGSGYDLWKSFNFVSGDLSVRGLAGDAVSKYIDTGIGVLSTWNQGTSFGLTLYCSVNPTPNSAGEEDLIVNEGPADNAQTALLVCFAGATCWDALDDNVGQGRITANNPSFTGYMSANYLSTGGSTLQAIYTGHPNPYIGHKILVSNTAASLGIQTKQPIYMYAANVNGSPFAGTYCQRTHSFMAAHYNLTQAQSQVLFNLVQNMRIGLGGGYINVDPVADWVARVVRNGGAVPSANTQAALTVFYNGLVSNNLLAKMKVITPLVPDSLTAALTPFWNITGGRDPWVNTNFVSGDLTVNGLKGDGSTKWLNTGIIPSASFSGITDGGLTVYVAANSTNVAESDFNVTQSASQAMALYPNYNGTSYLDLYAENTGSGRINATNTSFTGFISGNRGSNLGGGIIEAIFTGNSGAGFNTLVSSSTSSGGSLPTLELYAMALNLSGSVSQFTLKTNSFFAVHNGLTATEAQNFFNLVQALRTALGGGYV
jgi:hypothetical protein